MVDSTATCWTKNRSNRGKTLCLKKKRRNFQSGHISVPPVSRERHYTPVGRRKTENFNGRLRVPGQPRCRGARGSHQALRRAVPCARGNSETRPRRRDCHRHWPVDRIHCKGILGLSTSGKSQLKKISREQKATVPSADLLQKVASYLSVELLLPFIFAPDLSSPWP